jgi:hypothetical protein
LARSFVESVLDAALLLAVDATFPEMFEDDATDESEETDIDVLVTSELSVLSFTHPADEMQRRMLKDIMRILFNGCSPPCALIIQHY